MHFEKFILTILFQNEKKKKKKKQLKFSKISGR